MAADRRNARAGLTEIALEQEQVGDLLDELGPPLMLGHAHAVADERRVRGDIDFGAAADLCLADPRRGDEVGPALRLDIGLECVETRRMFGDEGVIEHRLARRFALEQHFHHALEQREVAADLDMDEFAADLGRAEGRHLDDVLRLGEFDQRAFGHRVDRDDRHPAFSRLDERGHHARRVGPGVMPDQEDRLGMFEVAQDHRALADADRRRQPAARRFVAHVRTVGKIVRAIFAHEDRIEKSGLVRGAARGVEFGLIGAFERAEMAADERESVLPAYGYITIGRRVVTHRFGQPALHLEPIIRLFHQLGDAVLREKFACHTEFRRLVRERLRTIFAEFELLGTARIGEGAARAFEPAGLVHREQRARPLGDDALFEQNLRGRRRGAPAAGGAVIGFVPGFLLGHCAPIKA